MAGLLISVGAPHPILAARGPLSEGMVATSFGGTPTLTLIYDRPTAQEIRLIRHEKARIGIVAKPQGYIWLFQIKGVAEFEAPMAPAIEHPDNQKLPPRKPSDHLVMDLHMVDTQGIVHALRTFTLHPDFCSVLERVHNEALASAASFSQEAWQRTVDAHEKEFERPSLAFAKASASTYAGLRNDGTLG